MSTYNIHLRERLSIHIHDNDIHEICSWAQGKENDHHKEELFTLMLDDDKRTSDNAAWVFTHFAAADNKWLLDKHDKLIDEVMRTSSVTKRRLILTILLRQPFTADNMRTDFLDFCLEHLIDMHEPIGIKALSMKLAYEQCKPYPELLTELRNTLDMLKPEVHTPGMKSAMRKILTLINCR